MTNKKDDPQLVEVVDTELGKALLLKSEGKSRPYYVDFLSASWKGRWKGLGKNHIFRRALGAKSMPWRVLDLTAGFGKDAVMAIGMGCEVTAVERHPVVFTMLSQGIERAQREDDSLKEKFKRLRLELADANEYLEALKILPDVIYLDPMFEKPKKSAKSPKEMQLLQGLVGESSVASEQSLLNLSLQKALSRVVVKRPLKGKALLGPLTHSFKGQSIRYDVYVPQNS